MKSLDLIPLLEAAEEVIADITHDKSTVLTIITLGIDGNICFVSTAVREELVVSMQIILDQLKGEDSGLVMEQGLLERGTGKIIQEGSEYEEMGQEESHGKLLH